MTSSRSTAAARLGRSCSGSGSIEAARRRGDPAGLPFARRPMTFAKRHPVLISLAVCLLALVGVLVANACLLSSQQAVGSGRRVVDDVPGQEAAERLAKAIAINTVSAEGEFSAESFC